MLDRYLIRLMKPALERTAVVLHRAGVRADQVTLIGFAVGVASALSVAFHHPIVGLVLMLISRLGDGLDGPLARLTSATDRGGFLDITLDFLFYASIPLAFAFADPMSNALAASVLLAAFIGTATSFLAFATLAAQRGLKSAVYPNKGIYYLGGLTEATETLVCFTLMCMWPAQFAPFAWGFAGLCVLTIVTRLVAGWRAFSSS